MAEIEEGNIDTSEGAESESQLDPSPETATTKPAEVVETTSETAEPAAEEILILDTVVEEEFVPPETQDMPSTETLLGDGGDYRHITGSCE